MPAPTFKEALQKLASRREVAADLTTAQWAEVPLALRERAYFSSTAKTRLAISWRAAATPNFSKDSA